MGAFGPAPFDFSLVSKGHYTVTASPPGVTVIGCSKSFGAVGGNPLDGTTVHKSVDLTSGTAVVSLHSQAVATHSQAVATLTTTYDAKFDATLTFGLGRLELLKRDPDTGHTRDIAGQPVPVVIGQDINLNVALGGGASVTGPFKWQVAGWTGSLKTTSVVHDYRLLDTGSASVGTPIELPDPSTTNADAIDFKFIRAGSFTVRVSTGKGHAEATFKVTRPTVEPTPDPWTICGVAANNHLSVDTPTGGHIGPPTLGLGFNDVCKTFGIVWNFVVHAPDAAAGELAMVQLITKRVELSGLGGSRDSCVEHDVAEADASSFYPSVNGQKTVQLGSQATFTARDAPNIPLRNVLKRLYYYFNARDYLMYKSNEQDSIWIPIAEMTWYFNVSAAHPAVHAGDWHATVSAQPLPRYAPTVIAPLPSWIEAYGADPACI